MSFDELDAWSKRGGLLRCRSSLHAEQALDRVPAAPLGIVFQSKNPPKIRHLSLFHRACDAEACSKTRIFSHPHPDCRG